MKILLTGGAGFVGKYVGQKLLDQGHAITSLDLAPQADITHERFTHISADTTEEGPWQELVPGQEVIINLAGANISRRWSKAYKKLIFDSRVETTKHLVRSLPDQWPGALLSTSAGGYYGWRDDEHLEEGASSGDDFLADVCIAWEAEAEKAIQKGARVAIARFAVVLGKTGGALGQMAKVFKLGLGGKQGSGEQWFPWIHLEDLFQALVWIMDNPDLEGPFNFSSPEPIKNKDLAKSLGKALHRPAIMPAPAFAVRMAMGEFATSVLNGQRMVPKRLLDSGFTFQYPGLDSALEDLLAP